MPPDETILIPSAEKREARLPPRSGEDDDRTGLSQDASIARSAKDPGIAQSTD